MFVGEVWAARSSSGLTSVGSDSTGSPVPLKNLNVSTFTLPRELGYIQESAEIPNSHRIVIHIQDAHCNYAAQKSINGILDYLANEYGMSAVNCEGASEGYDLSPFTAIPEKDIREKTADFFVREGIVSAAEYYAANNPQKVNLWGVEDPSLYLENLKVYRDSLTHKDEVDRYIKSIGYILDNLKRHIYSEDLLEFDKYYAGYKDNKIAFKEYVLYLIGMAQKRMIDIKSFSNIYLLSQTLSDEDKINFKRANNEKDEIVDKLKKSLSRNELGELMSMVGNLKAEKISQSDFYAWLVKKAKSVKFDISGYTELQKYMIYISLYSAVDRTKVTKEIDTLEYRIKTSLYENDAQRELGVLSKNLAIMKNMFNISLTRDDYVYYKEHMETFAVANYISFIDKKAPLYKISAVLDKNIGSLDEYRVRMNRFYECSLERDKAFIKNIRFTDHDRPNSIIITGGFHTENLRELFKNENVSYVSIMPKFRNDKGYESPYMKRLSGQKTALENVINTAIPAILNLQVVEILSTQLAIEVEGRAGLAKFRLAVMIMAALNRGEQFIFRINSEAYPEGSRPQEDKVVVFNMGEGGNVSSSAVLSNGPDFMRLASMANATLTGIGPDSFEFLSQPQGEIVQARVPTPATQALPAALDVVPVIEPSFEIIDGKARPISSKIQGAVTTETLLGEPIYDAAKNIVPEIARALRRDSPTYLISPAASEGDIAPTTSNNRTAEQILGKQGHQIHAKSYLAKGDWASGLKKLLGNTLPVFLEDAGSNERSRMAIRIMSDQDGKAVEDIKKFIRDSIISLGYSPADADDIIAKQIRFVPISIENVLHLNTSIDLFTDIGMMEVDRYLKGNYPGEELPPELRDRFIALLKLSISNFDELAKFVKTEEDVRGMLDAIFKVNVLLKIRPVDWKTIDDWKKAQDEILRSL
ncbi:MAG: hypothetical protein WC482_05920 [Candidatus Omnitrophota bacterium]